MKKSFVSLLLFVLLLSACGGNENSALAPFSSSDYQGENYENVVAELRNAGFTNVTTETRAIASLQCRISFVPNLENT